MTYCVVWKTDDAAFIAADSAITSYNGNVTGNPKGVSSLGQNQGYADNAKHVCEGAFKIFSTSNAALCLSGDVDFGHKIIDLILAHLENDNNLSTALNLAISNYPDFKDRPAIKIAAISFDKKPTITVLTNLHDDFISTNESFVEFGSPPKDLSQYTTSFHKAFHDSWKNESKQYDKANEIMLIRMLSLLQIYGMHNLTLPNHGIGGSFTGLYISKQGIHLQPDICYALLAENPELGDATCTLTQMKSDHFCIVNTGMCLAIGNGLIKTDDDDDRMEVSLTEAQEIFDSGKFDYIVILNKSRQTATAIQMNRQLHHSLLSVDASEQYAETIGFAFCKKLMRIVNDNYDAVDTPCYAVISFIGYEEASPEIIEDFEKSINNLKNRNLRLNMAYPLLFSVVKEGITIDSYLGRHDLGLPFIKHFRKSSHLIITDWQSGELELEYRNGNINDESVDLFFKENIDAIPEKENEFSIFSFILEPESSEFAPRPSQLLARDWDEAEKILQYDIDAQPEMNFKARRAQKIFYHPLFNRPVD